MAAELVPGLTEPLDVLERLLTRSILIDPPFALIPRGAFLAGMTVAVTVSHNATKHLDRAVDMKGGAIEFQRADDTLPNDASSTPPAPSGAAPLAAASTVPAQLKPRALPSRHRRPID